MSGGAWRTDRVPPNRIYRDRENGWIFGVCAGIAAWAGVRPGAVRIIAVICLLVCFWPTVVVYAAATLLLRERPLIYAGRYREREFWRRSAREDYWSHS